MYLVWKLNFSTDIKAFMSGCWVINECFIMWAFMFYIILLCLICLLIRGGLWCRTCTCRRSCYLSIHLLIKWFYIQAVFGNPTKWETLSHPLWPCPDPSSFHKLVYHPHMGWISISRKEREFCWVLSCISLSANRIRFPHQPHLRLHLSTVCPSARHQKILLAAYSVHKC